MPKKTRLNETMRSDLRILARKLVTLPKEETAVKEAHKKAAPLVRAVIEAKYPRRDMRVCQRYDLAHARGDYYLRLTAGGEVYFSFENGTGPLVPRGHRYVADAQASEAIENWRHAVSVLYEAKRAKIDDYDTLIRTARTLEEVVEIWPEAERVRPSVTNLPTALSEDVIERIRADVAARKAA